MDPNRVSISRNLVKQVMIMMGIGNAGTRLGNITACPEAQLKDL